MLFLIAFAWLVAASFAFVLAILTPNWATFTKSESNGVNYTIQRGIFYVCDLLSNNGTHVTRRCVAMLDQTSSTDANRWIYQFAIASAALAIACAGLSIIAIWFSGIYFQTQRRTKRTLCALLSLNILVLVVFCTSFIVWILLISEIVQLGVTVDRSIFNWPMWLAVGASGGYLMAFITMLFSCCALLRRESKMKQNYYHPRNQF